jgi:hypothetical protein
LAEPKGGKPKVNFNGLQSMMDRFLQNANSIIQNEARTDDPSLEKSSFFKALEPYVSPISLGANDTALFMDLA